MANALIALITKGDVQTFVLSNEPAAIRNIFVHEYGNVTRYYYIIKRFGDVYVLGLELNWLGRLLLT